MPMYAQKGFTLIELVIVIVILGILAAVAVPKFVDLSADAETAAINGMAGGLSSAASINYAGCSITRNAVTPGKCAEVDSCADVGALLNPALTLTATPSATAYYVEADTAATTNGTAVECTLKKGTGSTVYTAKFSAIGAAN